MRFNSVCRAAALSVVVVLSACGGGNGDRDTTIQVSTNALSFSAASPDAPTPPTQLLTATIGPETVYIIVLHGGAAIAGVSYTISGNTAQIVVSPASPGTLGAGSFTGAVTVTGYDCGNPECSQLVPGKPQIVSVTFEIPPIVRFVAPYVGIAGTSDTAIIRGQGFQAFAVQGVTFGAATATEFTVVSDTEIQATYPALTVGTYAVQIDAPSSLGTILSSANLEVIDPTAFVAATVAYPSTTPQVHKLLYDAERQVLLLAVTDTVLGGEVLRYAYSGGTWGVPTTALIGDLADIALSTNGTQLLALSQTAMTHTDPASLAAGTVTPGPALAVDTFLKNLAVANDDTAVVTTGFNGSGNSPLYLYSTRDPAFTQPASAPNLNNSTPRASANGSLIAIIQGDPTLTTDPSVYQFSASTNLFSAIGVALNQNLVAPALDRTATRIVLNGTNVYDESYTLLGTLPDTTLAVVVKPDATRAYTFDSVASQVLSFDLTATPGGAAFPQVGTGTTLAGDPGSGVQMAISPDGGTLFLAGSNQIVVQPSPP